MIPQKFRRVLVVAALLASLTATATASGNVDPPEGGSASGDLDSTQSASCVDGGGVRWEAKAVWRRNSAADARRGLVIDYVGWTTRLAGTVQTDSSVKSYDTFGNMLWTQTWRGGRDYASGNLFQSSSVVNPPSAPDVSKVTVTLGVEGDAFGDCALTFSQPGASWTPASSDSTPEGIACVGQAITPATDVQTVVSAAPAGTTFCFAPGTYNIGIKPKSGQTFDGGNRSAILDGENVRKYAFRGSGTSNVTIRGFVIQHYKTPLQEGAIHSFETTNWTIADNRITRNTAGGVTTDTGARVLNNIIDHNGQQGYSAHGENILYDGNEIAFNNEELSVDATWEAGGGKAWSTRYAVFRNNNVHHNGGNGMWDDTNNIYISYDNNTVANNWGAGIYHEIGYDATITNNNVTNNGTATSQGGGQQLGWLWNAGIQLRRSGGLSSASPILISGNTVTNNYNGISLLESPEHGCTNSSTDEGAYGPCHIRNILVRDNVVTMNQGATGVVQDSLVSGVFTSQNVRFQSNRYHVSHVTNHPNDGHAFGWFAWNDTWPRWPAWKGYDNDTDGTFGS